MRQHAKHFFSKSTMVWTIVGCLIFLNPFNAHTSMKRFASIGAHISNNDSVLIADSEGEIVFEKNSDRKLIPASSLKVLTALVALNALGDDFRFATDFYLDSMSNLKIKGYGDPLLVSENVKEIAEVISGKTSSIHHMILDNSYFESPIAIPGVSAISNEPYDAPNGALCVNFNSVDFICRNGKCVSGESQTPLLPLVQPYIENSGLKSGRIPLPNLDDQPAFYAGHLFAFFLQNSGVKINGSFYLGKVDEYDDRMILHYVSELKLTEVVSKVLAHSNNYMANQILLAIGAKTYGPPGSLKKGVRVIYEYADSVLGIRNISIVEGSGISRENRISSRMFLKILNKFQPYAGLMRHHGNDCYKTGTLSGIRTRVGYMTSKKNGVYKYVVMINSPGKTTDPIMDMIRQAIN